MSKMILNKAQDLASNWLECINLSGKVDLEECYAALSGRVDEEGNPVKVKVFLSPKEASDYLGQIPNIKDLTPWLCIWDYYFMAFYESAMQAAGLSHYFTDQSLLPAFKAGVGFIINLGSLIIGVCLPEAYGDAVMRIHREDGPAIVWGDTEEYWWRGVKVPKEWIMAPETVDPSLGLTHPNIEERRSLCEILGWEKILDKVATRVVDVDSPEIGTLLEADLPDSPNTKFLKVRCGTGRTFVLQVPQNMVSALQANCWTYDLTPEEFLAMESRT